MSPCLCSSRQLYICGKVIYEGFGSKSKKANVGGGILLVLLGSPPLLVLGVLLEVGLDGPDGGRQLL